MATSILFSVTFFQITSYEINTRLGRLQDSIRVVSGATTLRNDNLRIDEENEAASRISMGLIYANVIIFVSGGFGSFLLARRTLHPIQEAHEAQSRFTSDASHELRTPLATMKTEIEVALRDKKATKYSLSETLQSNLEEVEKLSRLSEMLLSLSRLDHDKLKRTAVNLYDITQDVVRQYNQPPERITVTPSKHSLIDANESAISELISILIDNALKYSPSDSPILITLSRRNRHARLKISNSGQGIDPKTLPYIFNRFYRVDTSRTKGARRGYGLGLALAKKIVELHSGELSVSSIPNQSTIFTVSLPIFPQYSLKG
ncbi:HAMP domain-containing histidine kinase [Candidatus Saccharibacteria bacterium]|nr:HAMP domain-containing histidine kinase [Candidatus Saccharibacteria bacterium]